MPQANEPFDLRAPHTGANTTSYRLLDGQGNEIAAKSVGELGGTEAGKIIFSLTGLPAGVSATYDIEAVGPGGAVRAGKTTIVIEDAPVPLPDPFSGPIEVVPRP